MTDNGVGKIKRNENKKQKPKEKHTDSMAGGLHQMV